MAGNGKNGNSNGIIEKRQRLVAAILIRRPGATRREMHHLVGEKIWNLATGKPFCLGTIQSDIDALKKQWRERADSDFEEWIVSEIATIDQLQGDAWGAKDYNVVVRCIQERAKLKGLYAPARTELTGKGGGAIEINDDRFKQALDFLLQSRDGSP